MQMRFKVWALGLTFAAAWVLMPSVTSAADDISTTKHDFTSAGPNLNFQGATSECETCHVPHGSTAGGLLWNHTMSSNTLTFGGTSTVSGTSLPTDIASAPGTSKFCLSCHDGSVAVGDMTVGSWDAGGTTISGAAVIGSSGDISGNHPVEIPYPDQAGASYNSITTGADPAGYQATPTGVKLFGSTAGQKGIGCASCHNPHDATNTPFLRVAEASLCSSCHIK